MTPEDRKWIKDFGTRDTQAEGNSSYYTEEQWSRLHEILISSNDLVFRLEAPYGFTLILYVFEDSPCLGVPPEQLIWIDQENLPGKPNKDTTWEMFTKLSHSPRNIEKCKFYSPHMPLPQPRGYYEY